MVKIAEIIKRTSNSDLYDYLIDEQSAKVVYSMYAKLLRTSGNFSLLSYELPSRNIQQDLLLIKDRILTIFPPASTARKMVEEMIRYFEWF